MTDKNPQEEPVTIVDNRKIDPDGKPSAPQDDASEAAAEKDTASASASSAEGDTLADSISAELSERTADLQRLTAEYANYRRRVDRDRKAAIDSAKAAVVTELLGVLDDLDRARAHGDLDSGPLKSVADKLTSALEKQGLEEFGVEGEPFDPTLHEAVQHEGEGHNPVIGVVMRKGYRFGDRVLRHALVGVTDGVADLMETSETTNAGRDADGAE
ncbi:nucleotide exchange factor GrpE [Nocardia veterana]|uniref:Protein GrpE n=1 Tax=Nocardia veterana TaxID=132249 RepID=A0A7X6RKX0_9NOCA|nr:nucleotide exchange factor GrpE [Nocardia veterana]NKY89630.1 nucleotide exchange factor GrpE [Nocardia veterana]